MRLQKEAKDQALKRVVFRNQLSGLSSLLIALSSESVRTSKLVFTMFLAVSFAFFVKACYLFYRLKCEQ